MAGLGAAISNPPVEDFREERPLLAMRMDRVGEATLFSALIGRLVPGEKDGRGRALLAALMAAAAVVMLKAG